MRRYLGLRRKFALIAAIFSLVLSIIACGAVLLEMVQKPVSVHADIYTQILQAISSTNRCFWQSPAPAC